MSSVTAVLQAVLLQLGFDKGEGERGADDRPADERHHVRHAADVVLVSVREHQRRHAPLLLQMREIGNDPIDAQLLRVGEHDSGVDDDGGVGVREREHVHAELTEPTKRNDLEHQGHMTIDPRLRVPGGTTVVAGSRAAAARSGCWARLKKRGRDDLAAGS